MGNLDMGRKKALLIALIVATVIVGAALALTLDPEEETGPEGDLSAEQVATLESQTGVTVTDEGVVEVDIGQISEKEETMPVGREEAESLVIESLGEGAQVTAMGLRSYDGKEYWAASASKGGEEYQVWIDAETGDEFLKQKGS